MRCPNCACTEDKVIDSRTSKDGYAIRRRRECLKCTNRFTTYEEVVRSEIHVIKNDGRREEFSPAKIKDGVQRALWKCNVVDDDIERLKQDIIREINERFDNEVNSSQIGECVMKQLKGFDDVAYIRFASVYRKFADVDEFIDELKEMRNKKPIGRKRAK